MQKNNRNFEKKACTLESLWNWELKVVGKKRKNFQATRRRRRILGIFYLKFFFPKHRKRREKDCIAILFLKFNPALFLNFVSLFFLSSWRKLFLHRYRALFNVQGEKKERFGWLLRRLFFVVCSFVCHRLWMFRLPTTDSMSIHFCLVVSNRIS